MLREMSALLAEQRVEIRQLQRENEGTVVCEVVRGLMAIRTTALLQEVFIITCQLSFNSFLAQAAKLRKLELQKTEVDKLKQQLQGIYVLRNDKYTNS